MWLITIIRNLIKVCVCLFVCVFVFISVCETTKNRIYMLKSCKRNSTPHAINTKQYNLYYMVLPEGSASLQ